MVRTKAAPGATCAMPAPLRHCLGEIFGDAIDEVEVKVAIPMVAWHFGPGILGATTRRRKIFINFPCEQFWNDPQLVLHEYYHVIQQWGRERMTIPGYLFRFWIKEREAREFAARHRHRLEQCLLGAE